MSLPPGLGAPVLASMLVVAACGGGAPGDAPAADPSPTEPAARFLGSWSLASWTGADGEERCAAGTQLHGQIVYTPDGHMSAQLGCRDPRAEPAAETEAEAEPATESAADARRRLTRQHFSYYGAYTIDPEARTVTHHVQGSVSPAWVGEDRVRSYAFEGDDRLVLDASGMKLTWVRNER